jgi:DNA-directed RNA polymerase specialized sigma24 family protein
LKQENGQNQGKEFFEKILSDKAHNKKWLNFAIKELRAYKKSENARYMEAEDYVEDAKLKILSGENIPEEETGNIDNYICGIIRNEISVELRKAPVMIPLSDWEDYDDEGEEGELRNGEEVDENLIVMFDDPFEEKENKIDTKEMMKVCYELLEKEEPELLIIFDERAKGHPNREIAKYLYMDVYEVEKMWKRIVRLLKKEMFNVLSLKQETINCSFLVARKEPKEKISLYFS